MYVSGPCMPTVPLPHVALQPAGAASVGRTGVTRVVGTRFAEHTRRKTGTGLCRAHGLQNAIEDSLIRVSSSVH